MTKEQVIRKTRELMKQRVNIPAASEGEYSIVHENYEAGHRLPLVSFRDAFFTGMPMCSYECKEPTTIHKLVGPEGVWMTDWPCEVFQMYTELAKYARGKVLIGGLGLGIVARMTKVNKNVSSITIVERQEEVIRLTGITAPGSTVIQGDIFDYAKSIRPGQFDVALLDTWQGTGEWVWQTEVVPLRRLIGSKIKTVHCWHELAMVNQVADGLFRAASLPAEELKSKSQCHWYAFRKAVETLYPTVPVLNLAGPGLGNAWEATIKQEQENKKNSLLMNLMQMFCLTPGKPQWEELFGRHWDEAWRRLLPRG